MGKGCIHEYRNLWGKGGKFMGFQVKFEGTEIYGERGKFMGDKNLWVFGQIYE